jgi:hypothetical protein
MAKYLSNRQQNLKIGIVSYTENNTVLEITGNVGIGTTNATHDLDINGDIRIRGALYDKDNQEGTSGQLLVSTATGVDWQDANAISVIQTLINTSLTGIEVKEEGVGIGTTFTAVNFVSSNITATASGNQAIITLTDSPSFTNANVTGVSTIGTVKISSGIITATSGIVTYYGDGQYLDLTNNPSTGIGIGTTGGVVGYGITFLDLKGAGVSSTFYNSSVGIATIFFEGGGGGSISISTTAPTSPGSGDLWYSPDYGRTFIYYDESTVGYGTDSYWIDAAPFNQGINATLVGVAFSAGSAISPSLYFAGDVQTGFFSPTPGQFTVVSTGSSILNVNPSGIRVTGVSTFSSVNVTGNVSIGGTLTYDDVTNVDSIGLVTARTGVRIDAGGLVVTAGVSTFTNGPVFIGAATSTGTATQRLQVTGGAYVSGNLGIGTTNPQAKVHIVGSGSTALLVDGDVRVVGILTVGSSSITFDGINNTVSIGTVRLADESGNANYSGIITATTFVGALTGTASNVTTNANLTGDITSVGNATAIATGVIVNADINASAAIAVSKLAASTISGVTLGNNLNALTISTGLSGSSYNGSGAVTIAIDSTVATLTGTQTLTNKTLTSPTLTTPALGTPSSGTLTSCTGLPIVAGTTGTLSVARGGTGVTASTGTGSVVLSTSPTLTTPVLGSASASSINVSGVSTFTNGPILVGSATSTGTATQRLQVTGGAYVSGNLGVGIINPASNTQVAIAGTLGISEVGGSGARTLFTSGTSGFTLNHNDNSQITFQTLGVNRLTYSHSSNFWNIPSGTPFLIGTGTSTGTANQLLRVEGGAYVSGNLGIGTINPGGFKLDVRGQQKILGDNGASALEIGNGTATNQYALVDLVGDTTYSDFGLRLIRNNTGANTSSELIHRGTGALQFVTAQASNMLFYTNSTERMRITSGGSILCDSTALIGGDTAPLQADGKTRTALALKGGSNGFFAAFYNTSSTLIGSITGAGGATTFYNTSSDYRIKENVVPLTEAISRVNQLQVHRFNFISHPDQTVDGFIAHEAQEVVPECVTGTKDAVDADGNPVMQGIDQSKLVPLLTAALQEAVAEIKALKDRVTALETA